MYKLMFITKDHSNAQGKPKVFFTCHPNDFDKIFEKICHDIFEIQNCAIYYTEDMSEEIPLDNKELELNQMNMFVIPITFELLSTKNRAIDSDISFALERHIPILPIMVEDGIDELYCKRFGQLQYLNINNKDITEISYYEKLKKCISMTLFNDEIADKIRAAFDAYIFLSYRKKDRKFANELMKIIHSNPICRDIAIWYDEFLIPGENFNHSIEKMLKSSDLFALLVTPNLINENNYVQEVEYPTAQKYDKKILPIQMLETNLEELSKQYINIPNVVNADNDAELRKRLSDIFAGYAIRKNDNDPVHNYFIGLAYLDGIDVEVNRDLALELIENAAKSGLPEAMEKLSYVYKTGNGCDRDYTKTAYWQEKLANYSINQYDKSKDEINYQRVNETNMNLFNTLFNDLQDIITAKSVCFKMLEFNKASFEVECKGYYLRFWYKNISEIFKVENEYENAKKNVQLCVDTSMEIANRTKKVVDWINLAEDYCSLGKVETLLLNYQSADNCFEKSIYI